mgnify:CR=1 FL=1
MFTSILYKPTVIEELLHTTVSDAITYISKQLDLGIINTGLIEYNYKIVALVIKEPKLTRIKIYDSKIVTNNLNLELSTPIAIEVVPNKQNNSNQSVLNNVTVGGSISLGSLHQSN